MRLPQFYSQVPPDAMEALDTRDPALRELAARLTVVAENDRWRRRADALWRTLSSHDLPRGWGFELILAAYGAQGRALMSAVESDAQSTEFYDMTQLLQHAQAMRRLLNRYPMAVPIGGGAIKNERRSPLPVNARHVIDYVSAEGGKRRAQLLANLADPEANGRASLAARRETVVRALYWGFFAPYAVSDLTRCIATVAEAVLGNRVSERDIVTILTPAT